MQALQTCDRRLSVAVHAVSLPARGFTGDFYYVDPHSAGAWLALGDVAGKGLPAAVVMAMIQEELEQQVDQTTEPAFALEALDRFLKPLLPRNRFVSAAVAHIDDDGMLRIANGGHCAPLIARAGGSVEAIPSTGPVLGVLSNGAWRTQEVALEPGDTLILYSDGVIEAEGFDVDRLAAIVSSHASEPLSSIAAAITSALRGRTDDDVTLLLARV